MKVASINVAMLNNAYALSVGRLARSLSACILAVLCCFCSASHAQAMDDLSNSEKFSKSRGLSGGKSSDLSYHYSRANEVRLSEHATATQRQRQYVFQFNREFQIGEVPANIAYWHHYTILGISDDLQVNNNAHLHTIGVPVQWQHGGLWSIFLFPALSASSNVLKYAHHLEADAVQLNFSALTKREDSSNRIWKFGVQGDHRFGDYYVYPSIQLGFEGDNWRADIGAPDSYLQYNFQKAGAVFIKVSPDGNRWFTKNKERDESSWVRQKRWHVKTGFRQQSGKLTAEFSAERFFHAKLELELIDETKFSSSIDDYTALALLVRYNY